MKLLKRLVWILSIFTALVLALAFLTASYFEANVNEILGTELNKRLQVPVMVRATKLSLLDRFPKASIRFEHIYCKEINKTDTLFSAEELQIEFDLFDLFTSEYGIDAIYLFGGVLNLHFKKDGTTNFNIWKVSETDPSTPFQIDLKKVDFEEIDLRFKDDKNSIYFQAEVDRWKLKGNLGSEISELESNGSMLVKAFKSPSYILPKATPLSLNNVFKKSASGWELGEGKYKLNGQALTLYSSANENGEIDLKFKGTGWELSTLLKLIPKSTLNLSNGNKANGKINFDGSYLSATRKFSLSFGLSKGSYVNADNLGFQGISSKGSYLYAKGKIDKLQVTNFSANIGSGACEGNFSITNTTYPELQFELRTSTELGDIIPFFSFSNIEVATGKTNADIRFKGKFKSLSHPTQAEIGLSSLNGKLEIEHGNIRIKNHPHNYSNINTSLLLEGNKAIVNSLTGNLGQSDFDIKGALENTLQYLLKDGKVINAQLQLSSSNINLDEVLMKSSQASDSTYALSLSKHINFEIDIDLKRLSFRNFIGGQITGHLSMNNQVFLANNISLKGMSGKMSGNLKIDNRKGDLQTSSNITLKGINIEQLFFACENFNQEVIGHQNLRGIVHADLVLSGTWDENLQPKLSTIHAINNFKIKNGQLIKFEPLMAMSDYVSVNELQHIAFETLENEITIKNQTIFIPQMTIVSSALDVSGSGTHTFNNRMNYKIQLAMSDLLFERSRKKQPSKFSDDVVIADDGTNKRKLHLYMRGSVEEPEIGIDGKAARAKIGQDIKDEGKTLVDVIKKEFGKEPEKPKSEKLKNSGIVIEWDEDDSDSTEEKW
ncbi:MAG: hypothetical protein ACI8ZO_000823 [Flavobacteriales bacterium]|jgi:uncharacterized protein involved in outer membrane biogenesis